MFRVILFFVLWGSPLFFANAQTGDLNFQALGNSLMQAGEMPSRYSPSYDLQKVKTLRERLDSGSWGMEPQKLTVFEAQALLEVADATIRYNQNVNTEVFETQRETSLLEARQVLFQQQIAYRKQVIGILIDVFERGNPSYEFISNHIINFWSNSSTMPRTPLSSQEVDVMKEELKDWLKLTRLTMEATKVYPNLHEMFLRDFFKAMGQTLIETTVFQADLVRLVPQLGPENLNSVKYFAVVKEVIEQMNLPVTDPMKAIEIEGAFPKEIREAHSDLAKYYELPGAKEYLEADRPKDLTELWNSLKPLDSITDAINLEPAEKYAKLNGTTQVVSDWNSVSLEKNYYQRILLLRDFIAITARSENPPSPEKGSQRAFDPSSVQFSDFLYIDRVLDLWPDGILATGKPMLAAAVLSKVLSEFIPLYIKAVGVNNEDLRSLVQDYSRFATQRPHDPYLTRLAYELSQMAEVSPELRLVTMNYVKNSAFAESMAGPYNASLEARLRSQMRQLPKQWMVLKNGGRSSSVMYYNNTSGEQTSDISTIELDLMVGQQANTSIKCTRLFAN